MTPRCMSFHVGTATGVLFQRLTGTHTLELTQIITWLGVYFVRELCAATPRASESVVTITIVRRTEKSTRAILNLAQSRGNDSCALPTPGRRRRRRLRVRFSSREAAPRRENMLLILPSTLITAPPWTPSTFPSTTR